jgi:hypothetical protein
MPAAASVARNLRGYGFHSTRTNNNTTVRCARPRPAMTMHIANPTGSDSFQEVAGG